MKRERSVWKILEGLDWAEYNRRNFEIGEFKHVNPNEPFIRSRKYYGRGKAFSYGRKWHCNCGCMHQADMKHRNRGRRRLLMSGWYSFDNPLGEFAKRNKREEKPECMRDRYMRKVYRHHGKPKPKLTEPRDLYKCPLCRRVGDEILLVKKWCDVCPFREIFHNAKNELVRKTRKTQG